MPNVICATTHCDQVIGEVGISARSGNLQPVWRIQPGWTWIKGILTYCDESYRQERGLVYEMTGREFIQRGMRFAPSGIGVLREVDLPICVRCPKCRRPRWVSGSLQVRPNQDVALVRP